MARYTVTYVRRDSSTTCRLFSYAPSPARISQWNPKARFAVRYYPSKKHWRVFDLENTAPILSWRGGATISAPALACIVDDYDTAMMWMQLMRNS
jgi:hypothetical protein